MSTPTTDEQTVADPNAAPGSARARSGETTGAETGGDESLAQLQSDLDRFRDLALRSQADFENFRKRAAREKEDAVKYANGAMLERLLPILDNFELGLNAARGTAESSPILAGMEMVAKQLNDFLAQHGVEPVASEGAKFDPNLHEAVAQESSRTVPEGHVVR